MKLSPRVANFLGFIVCAILIGIALYAQVVQGVLPCLLCILQRWIFGLLGFVLLVAAAHNPGKTGVRIYGIVTLLISLAGIAAATRQVWLQHQPLTSQANCVPGLSYLLQTRPLLEVLGTMIRGTRDCAEVTWRLLGLSMAEWALIFFILFAIFGLIQMFRADKISK